ncbi:MAG: CoA transferase [Dehalococcoidia bacterium]
MTVSQKRRNSARVSSYRVIEVADEKGVYYGKLLAKLGADTIKVEKPGGDDTRNIPPFAGDDPHPEKSFFFLYYNQNKKGITLNLECTDGQEIFKRLMRNADVIVESFSPGYLDSLGIGYSALNEINPSLIMTSITGFGQSGPYKDYKVTELTSFAMGAMFKCGEPARPPSVSPIMMSLHGTAIHAAFVDWIGISDLLKEPVWEDSNFRRQNIDVINPYIIEHTTKYTKQKESSIWVRYPA